MNSPASRPMRWTIAVGVAALLAGIGAWLLRPRAIEIGPFSLDAGGIAHPATSEIEGVEPTTPRGGVYGGRVVDAKDQPVAGASVLLAAVANKTVSVTDPTDPSNATTFDVALYGDFETVARTTTDLQGRFRLAAGDHLVAALFAYERSHAPGLLTDSPEEHLKPGADLVIRLPDPGRLEGKVVDAETKEPVGLATVRIYLQSVANQQEPGPVPFTSRNAFARFQTYVSRELGPAVWGIVPEQGDTGLPMATAMDGTFSFGPVMSQVQLDVVVTHPEYKWVDADPEVFFEKDNVDRKAGERPMGRKRRLVIQPGETVRRTYELQKGLWVEGRVVTDASGVKKPVEGVEVKLEHITQYAQHPWYRTHTRNARTNSDGRFRIAGLSYGPYNLTMLHPSFEKEVFHGVKPETKEDYLISTAGWVDSLIDGGPADTAYAASLWLDPIGGRDDRVALPVTIRNRAVRAENVKPGTFEAYLVAGRLVSERIRLVVEAGKGSSAVFKLGTGGTITLGVTDRHRLPIDPATVEFEAIAGDGSSRPAGRTVTREGVATATSVLPGRYRARVHAAQFMDVLTEPFDVAAERVTALPSVMLRRPGTLRITGVKDGEGRSPEVDIHLLLAEGDGEFMPVRPLAMGLIAVAPGRIRLQAKADDGRAFSAEYQVEDAQVVDVEIRITK